VRRQFDLPEADVEHLEVRGLPWETLKEGDARWLIVRDYPVPEGYNVRSAVLALRIPPSYPDDQIDMVYFDPPLALASGRGIGALSAVLLDGKQFQQWSRHRTGANPWRPGLDDIAFHLLQVDSWLARELGK
jgi:hypothetical protein